MKWFLAKGVPPLEGSGLPLASAVLGGSGDAAAEDEDDEELGQQFEEPICALVQNCTMLHNIVGPACIFLRQSFAQSQLVCTHTLTNTPFLDNAWCGHTEQEWQNTQNQMIIFCLIHLQSNPPLSPHYFHNVPSSPIPVTGGCCATLFFESIPSHFLCCQVLHADL